MKNYSIYIVIILLLMFSVFPILGNKYPFGHDWLYELVRISEYRTALLNGQVPPVWGANLYGGLGSPIFLYYAPLYSLIVSAIYPLTDNIYSAASYAVTIITLCGYVFVYLLVREILRQYYAVNEGVIRICLYLYALSPYLIADKFIRNASAEYAALCMAPLAIYGVILIRRKPLFGVIVMSLGLSLTILAHNLTALVVFAVSVAVVVARYARQSGLLFACSLGGFLLSLGMSSFFWFPALMYKHLVRIEQMTVGRFDFHSNFKEIQYLFDYSGFYSVGLVTPMIILAGVVVAVRMRRKSNIQETANAMLFVLLLSLIFIFLQNKISVAVWEFVPLMELFQFPWRMMGPLTLASVVVGAFVFAYTMRQVKNQRVVEWFVLLCCMANALPFLSKISILPTIVVEGYPELFSATNIQRKLMPATVEDEYLPKTASDKLLVEAIRSNRPIVDLNARKVINDGGEASVQFSQDMSANIQQLIQKNDLFYFVSDSLFAVKTSQNGADYVIHTKAQGEGTIKFLLWYFPFWVAKVDGTLEKVVADENGLLTLDIPKGEHIVEIGLHSPPLREICNWVSVISFVVWLVLVLTVCLIHLSIGRSRTHPLNTMN